MSNEVSFFIRGRLAGLNEYTKECRGNRYAGEKMKKENYDAWVKVYEETYKKPLTYGEEL